MDESFTLSDMIRLLLHSSFGRRFPYVCCLFFFTFYIAFFVHPSHLSLYYICIVQRVHINYQNKCAQMSFFPGWQPFLDWGDTSTTWNGESIWIYFHFEGTIPVSEAQGCKRLCGLPLVRGAACLPLPHHRAVLDLFGWIKRLSSWTLRSFVQKYFFFFFFSPPKRQVWRRQIWHFWASEGGGGAAVHAAAAAGTPHHHTARWRQTLWPGHKYSQMHYVQECRWDIYSKKNKLQLDGGDIQQRWPGAAELCCQLWRSVIRFAQVKINCAQKRKKKSSVCVANAPDAEQMCRCGRTQPSLLQA